MKAECARKIIERMNRLGRREQFGARSPFAEAIRKMELSQVVDLAQHAIGSPDAVFVQKMTEAGLWNASR